MRYPIARFFAKAGTLICKLFAVCSNSSYSWSLTRNLICRLSFLFSPINPTSYCSFFNRTSKHLNVFLLSTFYHAFSVAASSIFGTQISLFLLSQKCPLTPIYMGGLRPCLFSKRQPQKLSHIKPPTPESSGAPSPVGRSKKRVFRQAKRVLLRMCQFLKFSLHGSAKTADPFRCDLPLTHTIFSFLPVRKLLTIFRNAFEFGLSPLFRLRE